MESNNTVAKRKESAGEVAGAIGFIIGLIIVFLNPLAGGIIMAVCLFLSLASADKSKAAHNMPTMGYNKIIATSLVVSVLIALCVSVFRFAVSGDSKPSAATAQQTVSPADRAAAQQKLDDILSKAKTAGLVTSYDLSSVPVIYVGPVWYTQTVQFKKDFLASIAMGLQTTIGKYFLEARDGYSNETVGEVKAFGGSIEIYK